MLNTTNASNATAAKPAATASKEIHDLQGNLAGKYHVQRFEAKAAALAFSFVFDKLSEGKTYSWMCEATSLSPSNP